MQRNSEWGLEVQLHCEGIHHKSHSLGVIKVMQDLSHQPYDGTSLCWFSTETSSSRTYGFIGVIRFKGFVGVEGLIGLCIYRV